MIGNVIDIRTSIISMRDSFLELLYQKLGLDKSELTGESIKMLALGATCGVDDNLFLGLAQKLTGNQTEKYQHNFLFMLSKTFVDAIFVSAYSVAMYGSAAEALRALEAAGCTGAMALATSATGVGGAALGAVAVAELAEAAIAAGVSVVSGIMLSNSIDNLNNDSVKKEAARQSVADKDWNNSNFSPNRYEDHYQRHVIKDNHFGETFPKQEYLERARKHLNKKIGGNIEAFINDNGFLFKFNKTTGEYGIGHPQGTISTYFKSHDSIEDCIAFWGRKIVEHRGVLIK